MTYSIYSSLRLINKLNLTKTPTIAHNTKDPFCTCLKCDGLNKSYEPTISFVPY